MKHNKGRAAGKTANGAATKLVAVLSGAAMDEGPAVGWAVLTNADASVSWRARIMTVTPEMAKRWLDKNHPENRNIVYARVEAFANDLVAGHWKLLPQTVAFDKDGLLIDGQHRLSAVLQSGVAAEFLVVRCDESVSFHDPFDRGSPRSIATIMNISAKDQAALNGLRTLETGIEQHSGMTLAEAVELYEHHKDIFERMGTVRNRQKLSGPATAACIWALPIAEKEVLSFAARVATGEMIARGDPVFAYRNWLASPKAKGLSRWSHLLAALNCIRYSVQGVAISSVYTGETGYRAITGRRRALRLPYTPDADVVPGIGWSIDPKARRLDELDSDGPAQEFE